MLLCRRNGGRSELSFRPGIDHAPASLPPKRCKGTNFLVNGKIAATSNILRKQSRVDNIPCFVLMMYVGGYSAVRGNDGAVIRDVGVTGFDEGLGELGIRKNGWRFAGVEAGAGAAAGICWACS